MPPNDIGAADVFIDDFLPVALDINDNVKRVGYAVRLAIHSVGRQVSPNEPLPHQGLISMSKLAAEGRMEETKMGLGWLINTRTLSVSLPQSKFLGWRNEILAMLALTDVFGSDLEALVGRLGNAAMILIQMRHFTNRIRYLSIACQRGRGQKNQTDRERQRGSKIMPRIPRRRQRRRLHESAYLPKAHAFLPLGRMRTRHWRI